MKHIEELKNLQGLEGNMQFGTAAQAVRNLVPLAISFEERFAALEAAGKPQYYQGPTINRPVYANADTGRIANLSNADAQQHYGFVYAQDKNEDIKRALVDAQNAIEKALNHFRTTAENHKK